MLVNWDKLWLHLADPLLPFFPFKSSPPSWGCLCVSVPFLGAEGGLGQSGGTCYCSGRVFSLCVCVSLSFLYVCAFLSFASWFFCSLTSLHVLMNHMLPLKYACSPLERNILLFLRFFPINSSFVVFFFACLNKVSKGRDCITQHRNRLGFSLTLVWNLKLFTDCQKLISFSRSSHLS